MWEGKRERKGERESALTNMIYAMFDILIMPDKSAEYNNKNSINVNQFSWEFVCVSFALFHNL